MFAFAAVAIAASAGIVGERRATLHVTDQPSATSASECDGQGCEKREHRSNSDVRLAAVGFCFQGGGRQRMVPHGRLSFTEWISPAPVVRKPAEVIPDKTHLTNVPQGRKAKTLRTLVGALIAGRSGGGCMSSSRSCGAHMASSLETPEAREKARRTIVHLPKTIRGITATPGRSRRCFSSRNLAAPRLKKIAKKMVMHTREPSSALARVAGNTTAAEMKTIPEVRARALGCMSEVARMKRLAKEPGDTDAPERAFKTRSFNVAILVNRGMSRNRTRESGG
ncbi:hypothetical protein CORC01_01754 [Colletotrichum orchidophilum]|uniref:Uncharacterized protein n=1 Tax=Colletotrichum orchidophilum TaxID=1209926 RepID=A0A1G4BNX8_9PEZI|nr:uncharacterized protein CORC01_01754 [Colletotrichum orchidophilum]OHF02996.1 hypothetical protein CORC01_01754 [Colletotrichum orchidophilum]